MKKLLTLLSAVVISGSIMAQKPSSDDSKYSLEGMINYSDAGFEWNAPNLRMRYFINDNIAARLTLGLSSDNSSMNVYEIGGDGTGTVDMSGMGWSLGLGAEYHLGGTDKLSPYFSAGFNIGGSSYAETWANSDGTDYVMDNTAEVKTSQSNLGVGLGAGVDYYVANNIYLGLEMGFGFGTYKDNGGTVDMNGTSSDIDPAGSGSGMSIGGGNMGFRIGWRF
ncbi:MAG: OmpW family outer membrane protein [Crocinitomicaceae bacterium]|tara:strand:+ start:5447 stop:6112 length:666 start_codon:yes stop_codon:yes gene_type:complete